MSCHAVLGDNLTFFEPAYMHEGLQAFLTVRKREVEERTGQELASYESLTQFP
jgi:hypothetical protein